MVKPIKIFALPSHQQKDHTSGVDFARVIQPMNYLNGYKEFEVDIYDIHAKIQPNWIQVAKDYDVVFLNYTVLDWAFAAMGAPLRHYGKKIIYDIDDCIWHIRADNPTYEQFHANDGAFIHNIRSMIDEVDHVTTTTRYLRNVIVDKTFKRHNQITVLPNYIDLSRYNKTFKVKEDYKTIILHFGSTTHFEDLLQKPFAKAMERIMEIYPHVEFMTVGSFMPEYRARFGRRYINEFGATDIYAWIQKMPQFMAIADIVVAPVESDIYNRCKSAIKYLEYSSAKIPGVYQDINQYQDIVEDGVNGYLASTEDEWFKRLKILIDNRKLRASIGESSYQTAKKNQIEDHIEEYAEVIRTVLDTD